MKLRILVTPVKEKVLLNPEICGVPQWDESHSYSETLQFNNGEEWVNVPKVNALDISEGLNHDQ